MEKVWFIQVNGAKEGPFSVKQLKRDNRVSLDTLAWKPGMLSWLPIRKIPELCDLLFDFADDEEVIPQEALTLQLEDKPTTNLFFLVIIAITSLLLVYWILWLNRLLPF